MLGHWELLLLGIVIGAFVFPYVRKKLAAQLQAQSPQRPKKKQDPRIIELDEDHYEVVDDD